MFPNTLPAFPPGAVLPARNIQEISPDLENEFAWQESLGVQRQLGSRTSASIDLNVNRSHKHGFLDTNYPTPISKDVINAAGGKVVRTTAQADATRPITPAPNGFRRIELLTNEGRTWYEGVRFSVQHRTNPLLRLAVVHVLRRRRSPEPLGDSRGQLQPGARSRGLGVEHAAQLRRVRDLEHSRPRRRSRGMARERGRARAERQPLHHPLRADLTGTTQVFCTAQRTCNVTTPEGRNTARSASVRYADLTLTRTFTLAQRNRFEVRADVFNLFNNENFTSDGYIGIIGNVNFGKPTSGAYPGRQFQFGGDLSFLMPTIR